MGIYNCAVTVIKNLETLRFVPDYLETKEMRKREIKNLPYLLRHVPDQYKTQRMCDKAILENGGTLKCVPDCYKSQ